MVPTTPSSCPSCHHPLSLYEGRCARCGAAINGDGSGLEQDSGLELDLDRSWQAPAASGAPVNEPPPPPPPAPKPAPTPRVTRPTPVVPAPAAPVVTEEFVEVRPGPAWVPRILGVLALAGTGGVLLAQAALPERFPSLLAMLVWMPALTGAPSDFFSPWAWVLALLAWGLFALALAMGHRLARRARVPLEQSVVEWLALVCLPGVHLVGGPWVLGELGSFAESQEPGLRVRLKARAVVAVVLHVLAVVLGIQAAREPGEPLLLAARGAQVLSVAAFALVLSGMGRALLALGRAGDALATESGKGRGWGSATRVGATSGPLVIAAWAGALVVTVAVMGSVWFLRREARACEPGTALRHTEGPEGRRVSACVLPDGRGQGWERTRAPDGRLLGTGEYREGQRHGTFRLWSERGVLLEELSYAQGQPDGRWTLYLPGGQRALELGYAGGKLEGENTTYYVNGNPRYRKTYQRGVVHGRHAKWFESGLVQVEGAFNQGRPSGWWVQRSAEGKVVKQWSEGGLSADEATAGVSAVFMGEATLGSSRAQFASDVVELRAGYTREWWQERLGQLKGKAGKDAESAALYQLTLERARANGFVVSEKPDGVELALEPVH